MIISGIQKNTLIDYPGKIACVVFLAVCNFRCPWCYSSELVLPLKIAQQPKISEQEFFNFLNQRKGLLEGVVICGGEPTVNGQELVKFIEKIKQQGFLVKLDTNGSNPNLLKELVNSKLVDYVAMDIKSALSNPIYEKILIEGVKISDIKESVDFLKNSGIDFEFRTTVVPTVHQKEEFDQIAEWIGGENVKYYLQGFRPEKTIDPEFEKIKATDKEFLQEIVDKIGIHFKECKQRG